MLPLADLEGAYPVHAPLRIQILSFWHTQFETRNRLGSPGPLWSPRPPLREILDPPLVTIIYPKIFIFFLLWNTIVVGQTIKTFGFVTTNFTVFVHRPAKPMSLSMTSYCYCFCLWTQFRWSTWRQQWPTPPTPPSYHPQRLPTPPSYHPSQRLPTPPNPYQLLLPTTPPNPYSPLLPTTPPNPYPLLLPTTPPNPYPLLLPTTPPNPLPTPPFCHSHLTHSLDPTHVCPAPFLHHIKNLKTSKVFTDNENEFTVITFPEQIQILVVFQCLWSFCIPHTPCCTQVDNIIVTMHI